MKNNSSCVLLIISAFVFFPGLISKAQLPGYINRQATLAAGRTVLDPNNDGYTSMTNTGFGNNDVIQSEIAYKGIKAYSIEPYSDLRRGPNHSFSDFVPDSSGNGVYHYFSVAQNVLFRMRMGSVMPGSKGYSILMDTDNKFGASGANADTNYLPSTTGTNGNPGFEIEVVLETNFRIAIYNVDGTSSPVLVKQYLNWQDMSQVSIASTNDNGDPDFLIDFYIPFSDLQAAPFNLTAASSIRMCATTVMAPKAAIGGPRSDIYGTSGDTYEDFMTGQPGCAIFNTAANCVTAMCTAAPVVNSPINVGTVNITGTWTKSSLPGSAAITSIYVYKNGSTLLGTINNVSSTSAWTLNNITLINGDIISAKAVATAETMCLTSNTVPASACNASNTPATPLLVCTSGSKGLSGTNLSAGWTIHVDNLTRNVLDNSVTNASTLFGANTGSSPYITWVYSGGCSSGSPLTSGSYKVYYTNISNGCNSLPAYFCAAGNGGSALAGSLAAPAITTPSNSVFTTATKTIAGTTDANATVYLFVDGTNIQTTTAAGGTFTFSNLNLISGKQVYLNTELNTGTVGTSKCAGQTAMFTVSCFSQSPLINADINNQITSLSPVTGTSTEVAGTLVRVYTSTNVLVATSAVQPNGTWSTGNAGTTPAIYNAVASTMYYANAQNGSCAVSGNSASYTATAATSNARCGTITGPVSAGVANISGTLTGSFATSTVNLYLDGELIGTTITSGTSWGPITVNSTALNTLYSNGILKISVQESGKQEVMCTASAIAITCSPTPVAPAFTPVNTTINQNQTVTFNVSNSLAGSFYALADSATGLSYGQGKWSPANGNLSLTTNPFTNAGTYKVILKSTSISGVTQCSSVSATGTITVNNIILPLNLLHFKGKKQTGHIILEWATANELRTHRFEIERSNDGSVYKKTGTVAATGYNNASSFYEFADIEPLAALNYYRLKMIDTDGKYTYSHVLTFVADQPGKIVIDRVKPNPFTDVINIDIVLPQPQDITIQLVDIPGRVAMTKDYTGKAGMNNFLLSGLGNLPAGIYFIKILTPGGIVQQKILKVN